MSQAIGCRIAGSDSNGKNVPENRNSGVMPNRKIALNLSGVFCVAEKAAIGAANAIPVSTAAGMARTISGDAAAPNRTMTKVKTVEISVSRAIDPQQVAQGDVARRDRRGVHRVEDLAPDEPAHDREGRLERRRLCIAVAASSPGARNAR